MKNGARGVLAAALAAAGPAVVLALAWRTLSEAEPWEPSERVRGFEAALDAAPPDIVVLGSSYALADTDPAALAAAMGNPELRTVVLSVPGSASAVWYATLKGRVFDRGVHPRLVLVVGNMGAMMQGAVDDSGQARLREQLPAGDAALTAKAGMIRADDRLGLAFRQRARLRDGWREQFREGAVAALFGDGSLAATAAETVFAAEARDGMEQRGGLLPGVGGAAAEIDLARGNDDPVQSFLPELAALAQANGARFVVALPPTHSSRPAGQWLSADGEALALTWARAAAAGWVDLRDRTYPPTAFSDGRHMSREGAGTFSTELGEALLTIHALEGPLRPPDPPVVVTRSGVPPALTPARVANDGCLYRLDLPALPPLAADALFLAGAPARSPLQVESGGTLLTEAPGRAAVVAGCTGKWTLAGSTLLASVADPAAPAPEVHLAPEARLPAGERPATSWVYPGGGLSWAWRPEPGRGAGTIELKLHPAGEGAGAFFLAAGGRRERLSFDGEALVGRIVLQEEDASVSVEAEADAPFALVASLTRTRGADVDFFVRETAPRSVALFATAPSYAAPPPAAVQIPLPADGATGRFLVDAVDEIGCLRWEVTEGDTLLPSLVLRMPVPPRKGPKTFRAGDSVYFRSSDESDVERNGRTYRLRYRAERRCGLSQWLLAGDVLTQTFDTRALRGLLGPVRALRLQASSDSELSDEIQLHMEVTRGKTVLHDQPVGAGALAAGFVVAWPAPATIAEARAPLTLRLTADPLGPDLLLDGTLSDRAP